LPEEVLVTSSGGGPQAEDSGGIRGSSAGGTGQCPKFEDGIAPLTFRIEIEGVRDGTCADCNLVNGTYFVPGVDIISTPDTCIWLLPGYPATCEFYNHIELWIYSPALAPYDFDFAVYIHDGTPDDQQLYFHKFLPLTRPLTWSDVTGLVLPAVPSTESICVLDEPASRAVLYPV
jgi:hypothetical protein